MVSIGKIGADPDAGRYYVRQVASGAEDYYAGHGEAPGVWIGTGSHELGLNGQVLEDGVTRLLAAQRPDTGKQLRAELKPGSVAGFDLCFKAPKSVGLVFGIADEQVSAKVRDGHEAAVREALGYLEREACIVRRGKGGAVQLQGRGFVAAAFRHRTSRAGDPLLHTHVVIANEAQGPDGRWTALYGRAIYAHAKTAGYVYQAALRAELSARLGVRWQPVSNGTADIEGVNRSVVVALSKRRREILTSMRERGEHSARAAQIATLDTRRNKDHDVSVRDLRERWCDEALRHGLAADDIPGLLHREPARLLTRADIDEEILRLLGSAGLTAQASSFDRRDVVQAFAQHAHAGATAADVERRADLLLGRGEITQLDDGRFTTWELLETEAVLLADAERAADRRDATIPEEVAERAIRARPTLSDEQAKVVRRLTTGDGSVQVVRAPAGTGKTFALDAARDAWEQAGVPVLGCALSARAACELRDQAAVPATTIASLRIALDGSARLQPGSVLLVDEAGMVGTRDLAALTRAALEAHGRIVLVGDDRQLPEIDAGGAFHALAQKAPTSQLHEVRRQREPWDREALAQLRDGNLEDFARAYLDHGRISVSCSAPAARSALVEDWWTDRQEKGGSSLMLANRRVDVADLNQRAREHLRAAGQLGPDALQTEERNFAVGDRVIATKNDRAWNVHNGQAGQLERADRTGVLIRLDDGDQLLLPARYAHEGHLDHGYALTAHRAQGATVDRTYVLGSDELYREWGYTALSRHRESTRFYLSGSPAYLNDPPTPLETGRETTDAVVDALKTSRAEQLALTRVLPDLREPEHERLTRWLTEATARCDDLYVERQATPWYRRGRVNELDELIEREEHTRDHVSDLVENSAADLAERPPRRPPELTPALDPLHGLDTQPAPETGCEVPTPDLSDGLGPDLGF